MAEAHAAILEELTAKPSLKHIDNSEVKDRSAPVLEPGLSIKESVRPQLLAEIADGVPLKHVQDVSDRSAPHVDPGVHLQQSTSRKEVLESAAALGAHAAVVKELQQVASRGPIPLHHVEDVHDASKPAIPPGTTVHTWDKRAFLAEIAAPKPLHHVDADVVADRSVPHIEPDTTIQTTQSHRDLLIEIRSSSPSQLRHNEEVADRSSPVVAKTAALRLSSHAISDD